jgi:hypothetical protein
MPISKDGKFSFDDFASFEEINSWWGDKDIPAKDKEGYTPLGAAILNSVPPECVAYIMQLYTFNNVDPTNSSNNKDNPFIDVSTDKSKGKSPLEVACMAMNADAIDVLRSNYYEYVLKDEDGNPIPKLDNYGDPIDDEEYVMYTSVPLWDEYTKESYKYNKVNQITKGFESEFQPQSFPDDLQYKNCSDTEADWLAAAALPKADILIKLIPEASDADKPNYNDITDDNGNTLILLACVADCHESVIHIRDNCSRFNDITTIDDENPDQIFIKNSDDLSALDVALESQDTDLLPLLLEDQADDFVNQLLIKYFHEKENQKINSVLIKLITAEKIYDYIDDQPNRYEYGQDPSDPDYGKYYIIEYIEKENNSNLFNLLLPKYNDPDESYEDHLNEFFINKCGNIIAFLYKKSCVPFNNTSPAENLNALLEFYVDDLYVNIVEILFKGGYVTLDQLINIDDKAKRNNCIDKIFTSYNKVLFSSLIELVDSPDTHDNTLDVISFLYGKNYFTINDLEDLSKNEATHTDIIFEIIDYLNISLSTIDSSINNGKFKSDLVKYLFINKAISLADIDSSISNNEFKKSIIIDIFNDSDDVTIKDILSLSAPIACDVINDLYSDGNIIIPDDVYTIYDHYNDDLSDLVSDLKPLIGCRKFIDSDIIASDFYWAYSFITHAGHNWYSPLYYQNSVPPITDTSLKPVNGVRYKNVLLSDNTNGTTFIPTEFRLANYRNLPEFYISSPFTAASNDNCMIVSFNKSVVSYTFQLPEDIYSINNRDEITWNTNHPLYNLLINNRCYTDSDILATILFNKERESVIEGSSVTRSFRLSAKPKADVILSISSNKPERLCMSLDKLTFTPTNWNIDQEITFIASNDHIANDNTTAIITVSTVSSDTRYNGLTDSSLNFTVINNDTPSVNYIDSSINLTEGDRVTRSFRLNTKPTANVDVIVSSDCSNRLSIYPAELTFTPDNWNDEKTVTFIALNNNTHNGDVSCVVTIRVDSSDMFYNLISADPITVTISDDDVATIGTLAFTSGTFAVDIDPDTVVYTTKSNGVVTQYSEIVKDKWSSVYNEGYRIQQVPKSPSYTEDNRVFTYDLLYREDIDD